MITSQTTKTASDNRVSRKTAAGRLQWLSLLQSSLLDWSFIFAQGSGTFDRTKRPYVLAYWMIADIFQLPARGGTFGTAPQLTHSKLCAAVRLSWPSETWRKRILHCAAPRAGRRRWHERRRKAFQLASSTKPWRSGIVSGRDAVRNDDAAVRFNKGCLR